MKMTEILLLGTFHFLESDIDFYTEEAQAALEALTGRLAAFSPDCIAVEGAFSQQAAVDESYRRLKLSDFNDYEKMKTETLGSITMFGKRVPISYKNECIQIGYRLGKRLGLEKIHAVDEDAETGGALFAHPSDRVQPLLQALRTCAYGYENTLPEQLRLLNGEEWPRRSQNVYMAVNAEAGGGRCEGAEAVARWYERNLKIFSNLQRLAQNSKKLFVLYGAGHLYLLRQFINATEGLTLADTDRYLG